MRERHTACILTWVWILLAWTGHATAGAAGAPGAAGPVRLSADVEGALALFDRWLDAHRAYAAIPGISVGIVLGDQLVWQRGYGLANPARRLAANAETLYSICSISKLFTSIAVMQLRDAGALELDDPVAQHLEWFAIEPDGPVSGPVTIRGLLTHASGLPRESPGRYWSPPDFPFPPRLGLIEALPRQAMLYPAFHRQQYSNLGMVLAGEIVAARAGQPFEAYVRARILEPLDMRGTVAGFPRRLQGTTLAVGHGARDRDGQRPVMPPFDTGALLPAAGLTSNVVDLARFVAWNFRTLDGVPNPVLAAPTLRDMQRVHWTDPDWTTTWGLGFEVRRVDDQTQVGHDGACPGFNTSVALLPAHRLGIIVLTNASGHDPLVIVDNARALLLPALDREPTAADRESARDDARRLGPYTGRYDGQPWSGEVVVVRHGAELRVAWLPTDDVAQGALRLRHVADDRFRPVRDDDGLPGEDWTFERDADGNIVALRTHALRLPRMP
ncbi:MAG: serine hydrolase [Pseudomonadales bacterium]|nr:serine hydrolase [Pseudomonadales bacterium]